MPFVGRMTWSNNRPPLRGYVYSDKKSVNKEHVDWALSSLADIVDSEHREGVLDDSMLDDKYAFVLAVVQGRLDRMTPIEKEYHIFAYFPTKNWPGNPEVIKWKLQDGIYRPIIKIPQEFNGLIKKEEAYRRKTKNLFDYMHDPPKIKGIKFCIDKVCSLPPA